MISLNAIGKDTRHTGDFCIWRPDGSGDNLLVIFKTSALLIIAALPLGLIFARIVTDKTFRYCT